MSLNCRKSGSASRPSDARAGLVFSWQQLSSWPFEILQLRKLEMHLAKGCLPWFVGECSQGEWMVPSHCRDRTCPSGREGWQNQALSMEQHFHILEHWPQTGLDPFLVHCSYKALGFHSTTELQTCCMCWAMCPAAVTPRLRCAALCISAVRAPLPWPWAADWQFLLLQDYLRDWVAGKWCVRPVISAGPGIFIYGYCCLHLVLCYLLVTNVHFTGFCVFLVFLCAA